MNMNEVASKYGLAPLENFKEEFGEIEFYDSFLKQTDHILNKIIEQLIDDMKTATLVDFISVFINSIKDVRIQYKDVLECRKFAREEIDRLEGNDETE